MAGTGAVRGNLPGGLGTGVLWACIEQPLPLTSSLFVEEAACVTALCLSPDCLDTSTLIVGLQPSQS